MIKVANFSSGYLDTMAHKLQSVIRASQDQVQKETRMRILMQVLAMSENPAFQAALITALRSSNTFDSVKAEIANPSFVIDSFNNPEINRPAVFTTPFNVSEEFTDAGSVIYNQIPQEITADIITLRVGSFLMAKIVPPSTVAILVD